MSVSDHPRWGQFSAYDTGECWPWTGAIGVKGYGRIGSREAHQLAYLALVGPIPEGMTLDHTCHSYDPSCAGGNTCLHRRCVNPSHLEPVTKKVNTLRGAGPTAKNARATHCIHGHAFTEANTYRTPSGGRCCRTCNRDAVRRYAQRRRPR